MILLYNSQFNDLSLKSEDHYFHEMEKKNNEYHHQSLSNKFS